MEIATVSSIVEIVENAFRIATLPRSGAVFISVPENILHEPIRMKAPKALAKAYWGAASPAALDELVHYINNAKQAVLFLGLEASRPENAKVIRELIVKTGISTISTYQAAGVVSRELVSYDWGRVGIIKNQPADVLLDLADVIITVGYDPVEYDPEIWNAQCNKTIVHVNYHLADIHNSYRPVLEVIGDIACSLDAIIPLLKKHSLPVNTKLLEVQKALLTTIESGKNLSGKLIHPLRFIYELRQLLDDDAIVTCDIGSCYMWIARYFFCYEPHHLLFSNGQQTLGVGLPWAIAAKLIYPHKKVISISGDGGFLFSAQALDTAISEHIEIIHFVWVDHHYDMVYVQEQLKYNRGSGVELGYIDLVKFAESFGAKGFRVNNSDELKSIMQKALSVKGPVLIEVPIDYSQNQELFLHVIKNS